MGQNTVELTDANFEDIVKGDKPVVVDFWAPWCGPCLAIGPFLDQLATDYQDQVVIGKLNVDDNQDTSFKFGVTNIPTLLFFRNGELVDKQIGASTSEIKKKLEKILVTS